MMMMMHGEVDEEKNTKKSPWRGEAAAERDKEREYVEKLPSKKSSGHTVVDRLKDLALSWEFDNTNNPWLLICNLDNPVFFLDSAYTPDKFLPGGGYEIDMVKARAAWKADIIAGIHRPNHYYVSKGFYTEELKERNAKHTAYVQVAMTDHFGHFL